MPRSLLVVALLPWIAGCATTADRYPSLAIRDVERAEGQFEPAPSTPLDVPEVTPLAGAPLADRLAALGADADAHHRAFLSAQPAAARLAKVAAGSAIATPAWASAQVALADLDSLRSRTAVVLADLDTLMVAGAVQAENVAAIESVRQQVIAKVAEEDAVLARLRAQLR